MRRNTAGFTLIELVVTVSIIGILAAVAMGSFEDLLEHQRASATMNTFMGHIAEARITAITRRTPAVLCPSIDGNACARGTDWSRGWMIFLDRNHNQMRDEGDEIVRVDVQSPTPHLFISSTAGRPHLRYLPDGRSAGTNVTISICNRQHLLGQIIVNNVGRPRSQRPSELQPCPT